MFALNILFFVLTFLFFKYSQQYIEKINLKDNTNINNINNNVDDRLLNSKLVLIINEYLHKNLWLVGYLFIITSLMIDVGAVIILLKFLFLNEYKTPLILLVGIILRQLCQITTKLPKPKYLLWFDPGFPSLFVTYNVTSDFFFSGHTFFSLAVGLDFFQNDYMLVKLYALVFIFLEISFVIVTHSHYWMDVYSAIVTYFSILYFLNLV